MKPRPKAGSTSSFTEGPSSDPTFPSHPFLGHQEPHSTHSQSPRLQQLPGIRLGVGKALCQELEPTALEGRKAGTPVLQMGKPKQVAAVDSDPWSLTAEPSSLHSFFLANVYLTCTKQLYNAQALGTVLQVEII